MKDGNLHFVRSLRAIFESENTIKRRFLFAALFLVVIFVLLFVVGGNYGILNIVRLREERKALQSEINALRCERDTLKQNIVSLKYDRSAIERVARENYGMALPGEKVIKFVEPSDTTRHQ